jgi:hypothetical protein
MSSAHLQSFRQFPVRVTGRLTSSAGTRRQTGTRCRHAVDNCPRPSLPTWEYYGAARRTKSTPIGQVLPGAVYDY